jgi:hypothetical protein
VCHHPKRAAFAILLVGIGKARDQRQANYQLFRNVKSGKMSGSSIGFFVPLQYDSTRRECSSQDAKN